MFSRAAYITVILSYQSHFTGAYGQYNSYVPVGIEEITIEYDDIPNLR
ncbi:hypothetical protein AB9N12_14980 [Bacteroides sp. AN502(2024)]